MTLPTNNAEWGAVISSYKDQLPEVYPVYQTPLPSSVNRYIDHTQLSLDATDEDIDKLCAEAAKHNFLRSAFACDMSAEPLQISRVARSAL